MIFPVGDDQVKGGYYPLITYTLLFLNIALFLYVFTLGPDNIKPFYYNYGAVSTELLSGDNLSTVFSSMFLHGGWSHLVGNMLFLWIFADNVEAIIGPLYFLIFYLLGGIAALGLQLYMHPMSEVPMIGASGAISATLGAYLVMFPRSRVRVIILIFFTSVYIPAIIFLGFWFVQQFFSGIGAAGNGVTSVAWWAHIGGFIFGVMGGVYFRREYMSEENYNRENLTVKNKD